VPTPTNDFRAFVGKHVRIERDGVIHEGVLMGEFYRHVKGRKVTSKRWVLFPVDSRASPFEILQGERRLDRDTLATPHQEDEYDHATELRGIVTNSAAALVACDD
jgi:hypothetical protein